LSLFAVDLPLVIDDRRRAILGHIIRLPEETPTHTVLRSMLSASQSRLAAGWKRPPGLNHGKHGLQQVIVDQECDIDVI